MNNLSLEEVADIYSGNSINAKLKKEKYTDKNFSTPYVATKDLSKNGDFDYNNGVTIPDIELDNFKIAPKGSTLICMEGGSAGKKIGLVKHDVCFVNKLGALVPNEKIDNKYLYYSLQTPEFQAQFKSSLTGIIGGVSLNKLKKLQIPVPPLQEQEKIVEKLDKITSIITKRTNLNFESLINNLFLSHVNNVVKDLYENSPKVAVQDEIYTSDYVANGSFKSLKDNVITTAEPNFALLVKFNDLSKSKNLKKTFIDESSYNFLKKSNLYEGDLIINNVGANLGQVFIVPNLYKKMSIGPNCIVMRPSNNFLGEYLRIVMNSHYFQTMLSEIFGGAAQPKFNKTNFRSLMLPFIDLDKQNEIDIDLVLRELVY